MKKIDGLVIKMFIPPFLTWFLVTVFIFNMQFLWKYIDDIVGKGLEWYIIFELLFYQALAMIPQSLIFAVMLASVMTIGNLAEHYELSAMKSSGMSLFRVMLPLIVFTTLISIGSFSINNYAIPVAALKFKSRLYDIRKQKPALSLNAGKFNYDFNNFVIYITDKDKSSQKIEGVKIYDHTKGMGNASQTNAERGELFFTEDERYLVVKLYNGERQEEMRPQNNRPSAYPYLRISFGEFTNLFDMQQFKTEKTDEDSFDGHVSLLTIRQLLYGIDSLNLRQQKKMIELEQGCRPFFQFPRNLQIAEDRNNAPVPPITPQDTTPKPKKLIIERELMALAKFQNTTYCPNDLLGKTIPKPTALSDSGFVASIPFEKRIVAFQRAQASSRHIFSQSENTQKMINALIDSHIAHEYEIHQKFCFSLACLLFLFVGAPMGAIIRKGGFGLPVLVAFVFFISFIVLNIIGENLAEQVLVPCWMGSWLPLLFLFPISCVVTYKAMRDAPILEAGFWANTIKGFFQRKKVA